MSLACALYEGIHLVCTHLGGRPAMSRYLKFALALYAWVGTMGPVVCVRRDVRDPCWVEDNILQQYMWNYDQYSSQAYYFGSGNLGIMGGYACRYAHIYLYTRKDR